MEESGVPQEELDEVWVSLLRLLPYGEFFFGSGGGGLLLCTCFISLAASSSVVMPLRSSLIFMALAFRRRSRTGRLVTYRVPSLRIFTYKIVSKLFSLCKGNCQCSKPPLHQCQQRNLTFYMIADGCYHLCSIPHLEMPRKMLLTTKG